MGRSPVSSEINIVFEKPEDVSAIKMVYSRLQDMVRRFDFLGNNMPCEIGGEPLAMFDTTKATITRLDASSVPEIPGSFNMKISLADGTKGIYDEEQGIGQISITNKMILKLLENICGDVASSLGLDSKKSIMQKFINEGYDNLVQSLQSENAVMAEYAVESLKVVYKSIIGYASIAALIWAFLPEDDGNNNYPELFSYLKNLFGFSTSISPSISKNFRSQFVLRWIQPDTQEEKISVAKRLSVINYIRDRYNTKLDEDSFQAYGYAPLLLKATRGFESDGFFDEIFPKSARQSAEDTVNKIDKVKFAYDSNGFPILPNATTTGAFDMMLVGGKIYAPRKAGEHYWNLYTANQSVIQGRNISFGLAVIMIYDLIAYLPYDSSVMDIKSISADSTFDYNGVDLVLRDQEEIMQDRLDFIKQAIILIESSNVSGIGSMIDNLNKTLINLQIDLGIDIDVEKDFSGFSSNFNFDFANTSDISDSVVKSIIPMTMSGNEIISEGSAAYNELAEDFVNALGEFGGIYVNRIVNFDPYDANSTDDVCMVELYKGLLPHLLPVINSFIQQLTHKLINDRNAMDKFITAESSMNPDFAGSLEQLIAFLKLPLTMYNVDLEAIYGPIMARIISEQASFPLVIDNPDDYYGNNIDRKALNSLVDESFDLSKKLAEIIVSGSKTNLINGELYASSNTDIGSYYASMALAEINQIHYWNKDSRSSGKYNNIMLNQILSGNSDIFSDAEAEAITKALIDQGLIVPTETSYRLADVFSDANDDVVQENTIALLDILYNKGKKGNEGLSSDEKSQIYNKISIDNAIDGAENSLPSLSDMIPRFYVAFMWTKKKVFMPINYLLEYKSIVSIDIQKSREDPAHKAIVILSNSSGKLVNNMPNDTQMLEESNSQNSEDDPFIGPNVDKLLVKPGVGLGIYAIYKGRNVRVFEGTIASSSFEDTTVTIVADGYGADLMKPVFRNDTKLGGACTSPREMVIDSLIKTESERFGIDTGSKFIEFIDRMKNMSEDRKWLWVYSDRYLLPNFRYREAAANVYAPDQYWPVLTDKGSASFEQYFADYKAKAGYSAWDVITDAVNRVPGFVAYPMEYDIGEARLFFGKPEWFYRFTRIINPGFWERMVNVTDEKTFRSANSLAATADAIIETLPNSFWFEADAIKYSVTEEIPVILADVISISGVDYHVPRNVDTIGNSPYFQFGLNSSNYVYDGDTFYMDGIGYRLVGINAPEIISQAPSNEAEFVARKAGQTSKIALENLVYASGNARIVDTGNTDIYGRHLINMFVSVQGKWVNAAQIMLASGYAYLYKEFPISDNPITVAKFYSYANYARTSEEEKEYLSNIYSSDVFKENSLQAIKDEFLLDVDQQIEHINDYINKSIELINNFQDNWSDLKAPITECASKISEIHEIIKHELDEFLDSENILYRDALENILSKGTLKGSSIDNLIRMTLNSLESTASLLDKKVSESYATRNKLINLYALSETNPNLGNLKSRFLYSRKFNNSVALPGTEKFRKYWLAASGMNLISNELILDKTNVANEVTVLGPKSTGVLGTLGRWFSDFFSGQVGKSSGSKAMYTIKADDDIPDWEKMPMVVDDEWADTTQSRILVATSILMNSLKNMYQGVIRITGNPEIKPHDIISIFDRENQIFGECAVRTVRHMYGNGVSFVTELEVDPVINARDLTSSLAAKATIKAANFVVGGLIFAATTLLTGGVGTMAYLASVGAGLVGGKIAQDLAGSFLQYSSISAVSETVGDTTDIRPYLNTFEGFNVLEIKPLTKNGRPLVAGINGYSLSNTNANTYRNKKIEESLNNFVMGIKQFGYTYQYLAQETVKEIDYLFQDIYTKNYMDRIMSGD
ncbi:hypothetical protein [Mesotoga prima]|uniref:thermonuclease family protein n=1 Tax=Mesotoga prima TaxID=1184387 RepID=UPI002FD880EF